MTKFLSYLNIYLLLSAFKGQSYIYPKIACIFLVVGEYQSRAPKAYPSIYLD